MQSTTSSTHQAQDPHIQFTTEDPNQEGVICFLDTLVFPGPHNTLVTIVYRKTTYMDQYLHLGNSHFITVKTVFLIYWHLRQRQSAPINIHYNKKLITLEKPFFPAIFHHGPLIVYLQKFNHMHNIYNTQTTTSDQHNNSNNSGSYNKNISLVVSCTKGLGEKFKKTMAITWSLRCILKETTLLELLFMAPKDKDNKCQKNGVIYWFKCPHSFASKNI